MTSAFDPFSEWLDLKGTTGPLDHYQLLGLPRFESNETCITEAADRALSRVRSYRPGGHAQAWAELLDQIGVAKSCLLNASARADYDRGLQQGSRNQDAPAIARPSPNAAPNPGLGADNIMNPVAHTAPVASPIPGLVPPNADPIVPVGVPTAQSMAPASPVPGFANSPTSIPGVHPQGIQGQPLPAVDPMAPLHAPVAQAQAVPMQTAPMSGYANLVPQPDPMAPVVDPIAQPVPASMAGVAQPLMAQPAMAQPAMAQPVLAVQTPTNVESPPPVAATAADGSQGESPTIKGNQSATAHSRGQVGFVMPLIVGVAIALLLLLMGGLYWIMGDSDDPGIVAETNRGSGTAVSDEPISGSDGESTESTQSSEGHADTPVSDTTPPRPESVPDPDPPMKVDPPSPEPAPPAPKPPEPDPAPEPSQPSRADLLRLGTQLKAAREALLQHDFRAATTILADAAPLVMLDAHQAKFDRLRQATENAAAFYSAIVTGTGKLQAGEALEYNGNSIGIVETSATRIILRVGGMNKRYELTKVPLGLAVLLAHQAVSSTDSQTILQKACYVITSPAAKATDKTKARDWFVEASASLPDAEDLAKFLEDNYDLGGGVDLPKSTEMPDPPTTTDPATKPTRQEVMQLATALAAARKAIASRDVRGSEEQLVAAALLAKRADHRQKLWRLQRLAEHVQAFDDAMKEAVAALKPGDVIKVGNSTELVVERINPASIVVQVAGLKKTYPLDNPPLGLAVALVQTQLSPDDPVTKAVQAAFVVVSKNSDERSLTKARTWYEESAAGNPDYADLGDVIDDDYNLLKDFQEE